MTVCSEIQVTHKTYAIINSFNDWASFMLTETMEEELLKETISLQDSMALKERENAKVPASLPHTQWLQSCRQLILLSLGTGRAAEDAPTENVGDYVHSFFGGCLPQLHKCRVCMHVCGVF